jgi:hypothetical protein
MSIAMGKPAPRKLTIVHKEPDYRRPSWNSMEEEIASCLEISPKYASALLEEFLGDRFFQQESLVICASISSKYSSKPEYRFARWYDVTEYLGLEVGKRDYEKLLETSLLLTKKLREFFPETQIADLQLKTKIEHTDEIISDIGIV